MNLLLVEDNQAISQPIKSGLSHIYTVDIAATGEEALELATKRQHQLIILDLNLPDMAGSEVYEQLRAMDIAASIIIVTGDSAPRQKINLLDAGADDYLTKPFVLGELKARLRVMARHLPVNRSLPNFLTVADLQLNTITRYVNRAGYEIDLRRKEFALLECLMQNAGGVVTREMLTSHAWGERADDTWTNTIDVHIKYLRDKIDRPFAKPLIKTVHGIGYKLEAPQGVATI